jgi:predicted DNA-binding transcriptional regulator AlpA
MSNNNFPQEGFVRISQILTVIPVGKSTLWTMVKEGTFPAPVDPSPFGNRVTVWRAKDVLLWIESAGGK